MGSAAQPRKGTAPNAPAASRPPDLMRNSRRPCRFDRARQTEFLPASFMYSSLFAAVVAVCVRVFRLRRYRVFFWMVTAFNIVYNTVVNFYRPFKLPHARSSQKRRGGQGRKTSTREDDGRKNSQTRDRSRATVPRH